jgi:ribbon-helix-helix protein
LGRRKISTTVYLEEEQIEMLEKISEVTGRPVAEIIREGIDLMLVKQKDNLAVPDRPLDFCIWCNHVFGLLAMNKEGRPVRCYPDCGPAVRTGWQMANRPADVGHVMSMAKKQMDDLSCRPPEPTTMLKL